MSTQQIWNPVRWTERWAAFSLQTHCANRVEFVVLNQNPLCLRLDRGKGQWRPGIWSCFAMGWSCCIKNSGRLQRLQGNTSNIFSEPVELNSLKKSSKDLNLCNFCWLRWFSLNRVTNYLLRRGRTPLWHASSNGSTSVMQMLLDAGAGVDAKSNGRLDEKIEKTMGLRQRGGISWYFMIFLDENPFDMML